MQNPHGGASWRCALVQTPTCQPLVTNKLDGPAGRQLTWMLTRKQKLNRLNIDQNSKTSKIFLVLLVEATSDGASVSVLWWRAKKMFDAAAPLVKKMTWLSSFSGEGGRLRWDVHRGCYGSFSDSLTLWAGLKFKKREEKEKENPTCLLTWAESSVQETNPLITTMPSHYQSQKASQHP